MSNPRVALITGGGKRRVGWHVASALADKGYALAIHYRSSATEAQEAVAEFQGRGCDAAAFGADVSNEAAVTNMVDEVFARFGRIDALVHTAAIYAPKRFEEVTAIDVRRNFETNALGTFLCCQRVGLAMVAQPQGGSIVTFGDWATARPYLDFSAYFPSKGAIPALTRSLAVELGTRNPNVRVNCILPGPVMFPPDLPEEERQKSIQATLVKRGGTPAHVAQAVIHFLENDFLTGVCLPVDGGRTIYATDSEG